MYKVITTTHYNRPQYTKQCIEHFKKLYNINNYLILFFVEPDDEKVIDIILESDLPKKNVFINHKRMGIFKNKLQALEEGFKLSDYVIHIEDDILLAQDALLYFEWANKFKSDDTVFSVTAYHKIKEKPNRNTFFKVKRQHWYTCWGFATWKDRWQYLQENKWNGNAHFLLSNLLGGKLEICPLLSRAQNVGIKDGYHSAIFDEAWYKEHHLLKYWYENVCDGQIGQFEEI